MKNIGIFLALILLPAFMSAQSYGEIQGTVYDSDGKTTLPGATVSVIIAGTLKGAVTDLDGQFKIKPLAAGIYDLTVSFVGYHEQVVKQVQVKPDKITYIDDQILTDATHTIPGALIEIYEEPLIDPDNTGLQTIPADIIEKTPEARNIQGFIAKVSTGVTTDETGQLFFRGARGNANLYMIDGVKIRGSIPTIPGSGIGSISVYTGGVPAKYGDFTGGVVVIETKNYFDIYKEQQNK